MTQPTYNLTDAKDPFVHLHCHSHFSVLDGYSTIDELIAHLVKIGQPAVAVTDHGNLHAAQELYRKAIAAGIKPIIGIEAYMAPSIGKHTDHRPLWLGGNDEPDGETSAKGAYTHLLLFAKNNEGLKSLYKLNYLSYKDGNYKKNRIDVDLLREHAKGNLIGTTGCPSGEVQVLLRLNKYDEALEHARTMQEIFGKENYYMELMDHNMSIELERTVLPGLLKIAETLDIPLLATADSHYTKADDALGQEQLLAISTGALMSEPTSVQEGAEIKKTRFAFDGEGYYLKTRQEMAELFPEDKFPDALSNTLKIAEQCNVTIEFKDTLRPKIIPPAPYKSEEEYLIAQAEEGLKKRFPDTWQDPKYRERLDIELSVIVPKGYASYFLVVADFINWAKSQDIPVGPGRGSAAGSFLAYLLGITNAEPIRHGLLFERFLNPERDSPPDADIDFSDRDRERVIQYVIEKYGEDKVAFVSTYGMIKAKNAVKDICRIYGEPFATGNDLTKAMPEAIFGKGMPLKDMYTPGAPRYDEAGDFRELVTSRGLDELVGYARKIEGRVRNIGVHACAVIISDEPLIDNVPLWVRKADGATITQWDYPTAESLGLLKMDFLGLRNLAIMKDAVDLIKERHGIDVDLDELVNGDMQDEAALKLLREGNTLGVFQLDSTPIRSLLRLMQPTGFEDISAVLALYRPGPMGVNAHIDYALRKNGKQEISYVHPELEEALKPILGETYGIIVYQEQIMKLAQVVAGYSLGEADLLRRAMGKKKKSEMDAQWERFSQGGIDKGYSLVALETLWETVLPFADYAFNKSHSVAYGLISYMTAYLKANFKAEYFAALLSSVMDDKDKTAEYLEDAKLNGIHVFAPDVSRSQVSFYPVSDRDVYFGLQAMRGVGSVVAEKIVKARFGDDGVESSFADFSDFVSRVMDDGLATKGTLEALALGGAFDGFGVSRKSIFDAAVGVGEQVKKIVKSSKKRHETEVSLFDFSMLDDDLSGVGGDGPVKHVFHVEDLGEWARLDKLKRERHSLGLYVSDHPVNGLDIAGMSTASVAQVMSGAVKPREGWGKGGSPTKLAGVVTSLSTRRTKKGEEFGIFVLEDRTGKVECLAFPRTWQLVKDSVKLDGVLQAVGFPQKRSADDDTTFIVDEAQELDFSDSGRSAIRVKLSEGEYVAGYQQFTAILDKYRTPPGQLSDDIIVSLLRYNNSIVDKKLSFGVVGSADLVFELQELFGATCIGRWFPEDVPGYGVEPVIDEGDGVDGSDDSE